MSTELRALAKALDDAKTAVNAALDDAKTAVNAALDDAKPGVQLLALQAALDVLKAAGVQS